MSRQASQSWGSLPDTSRFFRIDIVAYGLLSITAATSILSVLRQSMDFPIVIRNDS